MPRRALFVGLLAAVLILVAAPAPTAAGDDTADPGWAWLIPDGAGSGAAWDPCSPITWTHVGLPRPRWGRDVRAAVAEAAALSGFTFTRVPADQAQVRVEWRTPSDDPGITGYAGLAYLTGITGYDITAGTAAINPEVFRRSQHRAVKAVVLHELGHVLGLDHHGDPGTQTMSAPPGYTPTPGDRAGFAAIGTARCATTTKDRSPTWP